MFELLLKRHAPNERPRYRVIRISHGTNVTLEEYEHVESISFIPGPIELQSQGLSAEASRG